MTSLCINGGLALLPSTGRLDRADLQIEGGTIAAVTIDPSERISSARDCHVLDAAGALVLPGVVDLHGDAFERAVMPRGGVMIDIENGLSDNDPQLLAAGITTAFLSLTDSWEPGLRSRDTLRNVLDVYDRQQGGPSRMIHVRRERCNTENFDELLGWIEQGRIHMVSYNDHTPGGIANKAGLSAAQVSRSGTSVEELEQIQHRAIGRRAIGAEQDDWLAQACRKAGLRTASHDAGSLDDLERDLRLGVAIAEFPFTIDLAHRYLACGIEVLLGAPNLVRGGSHIGNLSVRDAVAGGAATLLCSDYHYPSLLRAPFVLVEQQICSLPAAWAMISSAPARAAGLADRGVLEAGKRADLVVVEPPVGNVGPRVRATIVGGEAVYQVAPA